MLLNFPVAGSKLNIPHEGYVANDRLIAPANTHKDLGVTITPKNRYWKSLQDTIFNSENFWT